jgi:hypothetical protein
VKVVDFRRWQKRIHFRRGPWQTSEISRFGAKPYSNFDVNTRRAFNRFLFHTTTQKERCSRSGAETSSLAVSITHFHLLRVSGTEAWLGGGGSPGGHSWVCILLLQCGTTDRFSRIETVRDYTRPHLSGRRGGLTSTVCRLHSLHAP